MPYTIDSLIVVISRHVPVMNATQLSISYSNNITSYTSFRSSVLRHGVNEYDVITSLRLNISVIKYNIIIKMVFLCIACLNKHIYVIK